ncbi:MAG: hypothetical protein ACK5PG_01110 [Lysobacterales bacterium]
MDGLKDEARNTLGRRGLLLAAVLLCMLPLQLLAQVSNLKAWSLEYNATTAPSGSINAGYTMPAGSNRMLVLAVAATRTSTGTMTPGSASWGGQPMTLTISDQGTGDTRPHSWIYTLNEAGIAAASGTVLAVTVPDTDHEFTVVYAAVYQGVDQSAPIASSQNFNSGTTPNNTVGPFAAALAIPTNGIGIGIVNLVRNATGGVTRSISGFAAGWSTASGPAANPTTHAVDGTYRTNAYLLLSTTAGDTTSQHAADNAGTNESMTAIALRPASFPHDMIHQDGFELQNEI